jgi:aspartate/tyrosine/aromatic aminotransferase
LGLLALNLKKEEIVGEKDLFSHVKMAPPDPILGTAVAYRNDPDANKINLGIGAYRDDTGTPYVFPVVRKVEQEILSDKKLDKEYLPIEGLASFITGTQNLLFGTNSAPLKEGRIASVQSLSGTGALRIGFEFIKAHLPRTLYISNPTWLNHPNMIERAGLKFVEHPYYNPQTKGVDIKGMLSSLEKAEPGSIVLLHACAHNPTGVDPTQEDWK